MKVKYHCMGVGSSTFHSSKTNRDYQRMRLMGMYEDAYDGSQAPAIADIAFDVSISEPPKAGQTYLLDCSEVTTRNAMLSLTFTAVQSFTAKKS